MRGHIRATRGTSDSADALLAQLELVQFQKQDILRLSEKNVKRPADLTASGAFCHSISQ
ncbi:hypothetical protein [Desulfovibrio porci]|uniref:hypothetical protein n=1 Tax=Desulfovibrio porci TaxID=2605782 RepID=UPI0018A6D002|nr:hypothetical protein [Desulfovibrio porci]